MKRAAHAVAETVLTALALAVFFVLLEMVKACRSSQWSGTTAQDALGFLAGMGLYCVAALTLLFTVRWLLGALRFGAAALPVATVIAGGLIWLLLSRYREVTPTPDDVLVIGGMLGFGMGLWLLPKTRRFGAAGVCALALTVLFAGGSSLVAAGGYFLFVPDRAKWVTFLPALWMLLVAIPGLGVWCYTRRARLAYAVAAVLLPQAVFALGVSGGPEEPSARPNIVFVVSDALRADYLRAYGGTVPTPHLEQFAQTGAFFEEAYSLAPWTLPSLTAMFASDYPAGLTPEIDGQAWLTQIWQYGLAPKSPTLAELLRKEGYATAAITSNALLWTIPGLMNGFDVTATSHPITLAQAGLFRSLPFLQPALAAFFPGFDQLRPHNASADVASYARAYLNRVGRQPFFLWLHYIDPHAPYDPPARYRSAEGPWPFFYPYAGGERWGIPKQGPGFDIAPGDRAYVQSLYEGEIRYVDELVGQVFAQLRGLGLDKNTYICFTSDHGEELWDHGDWGHGHAVYQEEVRVPLMLAGPGIRVQRVPGGRVRAGPYADLGGAGGRDPSGRLEGPEPCARAAGRRVPARGARRVCSGHEQPHVAASLADGHFRRLETHSQGGHGPGRAIRPAS